MERRVMHTKHIGGFKTKLMGLTATVLSVIFLISGISFDHVAAYSTAGAFGRSLQVVAGFSVNSSLMAPLGTACRSGQALVGFAGVTIHETSNWNTNANARMHAQYLQGAGSSKEVSWHYCVDNTTAYQSIPENEKAWHAGDTGKGTGNASTVAIEICDNAGGNFDQAMANAEWLAADILFRHNVHQVAGALFQHHDFSSYGKNCPITIRDSGRWGEFCANTQKYLDQMVKETWPDIKVTAYDSTAVSGPAPVMSGYAFSGWHKDAACQTPWNSASDMPTAGVTVYAKWTRQSVVYQSSIQDVGWQGNVRDGTLSGTSSQSKRLEAFSVALENIDGGVEYHAHVQDYGWMGWTGNGAVSGTVGESRRLEAVEIRLTGNAANQFDIYYRVHVQNFGWLDWASNGSPSGSAGYSYRVEAIQIVLAAKGSAAPGAVTKSFVDASAPMVNYQSSVQDIGWTGIVNNGTSSGTSGQGKRMEAVQISLANIGGSVDYRTYVQDYGWMPWTGNGGTSGTIGESRRMEAIEIALSGTAADHFDIYYRVHVQNIGWMDWAMNGEPAGSAGYAYRVEALQVVLVPKGGAAPGATSAHFADNTGTGVVEPVDPVPGVTYASSVQDYGWMSNATNGQSSGTTGESKRLEAMKIVLSNLDGGIEYRSHVQDYGWMEWTGNGAQTGTTGESKRLEALEIRLTGAAAEQYDVYYRVHSQNFGWLDWASNGGSAGTAGFAYRVEAVQIVLVPKGGAAPGATAKPFVQNGG